MSKTQQVIERAMAVVAVSRAIREAETERRRSTFQKIEVANRRRPNLPKGIQLLLDLH